MSAENTDFDFGKALEHLKAGARVSRRHWQHYASAFLVLVEGREVTVSYEPMKSHLGEGAKMYVSDHIDKIYVPNGCSVSEHQVEHHTCLVDATLMTADLLSEDWFVWEDES